jgi:hypothetical protein
VFGPAPGERPDVLTDAETVVLPLWLHRRASSTDGKSGASAASFLKTFTVPAEEKAPAEEKVPEQEKVPAEEKVPEQEKVPAEERVPAQEEEAPRPAPGAGAGPAPETAAAGPETAAAPETRTAPESAAGAETAAGPQTSEPPETSGTTAAPQAGTEPVSDDEDLRAEAGDPPRLSDPAGPDQAEAEPGEAAPADASPGEASVVEADAVTVVQAGPPAPAPTEAGAGAVVEADGATATATGAQADSDAVAGANTATAAKADADADTVIGGTRATAAKADADTVIGGTRATAAKADADADTVIGAAAMTALAADPHATTLVVTVGRTATTAAPAPATSTPAPATSAEARSRTAEPAPAESPGSAATRARTAGPNAPALPRATRPDAEVTTTLSRAELKAAMVHARTMEAVESIEAIDALESTTLGSLEAQTAKARKTVEAISVLEARTAQAMRAIEAMTADAFEAIDARVAEMTPELTGTLVPPDQAAKADEADADAAETPAADGADSAEPPAAEAAPPDSAGDAGSSPGTDVARTRVIHLDEPPPSVTLTTSSTETIIAVPQPRGESLVAVAPAPAATTTAPLPLAPTAEPPALPAAEPQPEAEPPAEPRRARWSRHTRISRLLLLCILAMQAILSLRLHNTAFEDEALYLYSGHMELEHLLHGAALQGSYASYFSGAPVLYPVAAGFLNELGGLTAARMLSLAEMLSITALLYSLTRRLFNERVGLCAALLFSVTESAIFLGNFATYDATCLFLLACAAWIMVRTGGFRWPVFILAAPVAALAVGVKYAGLLFVPTIAVLPALAGYPLRGRWVLLYPPVFVAAVGGLLYEALKLGGKPYMTAISSTTTQRAQGVTPVTTLLRESAEWGGVIFVLAVIGTIAYVRHIRTEPDEVVAPAGGRFRRLALGVVLTGTALLAPAYQAHLHTDISFQKHIGFGLFFAAPMAGLGLARVLGDHLRRPHVAVGIGSLALVLGVVQSAHLYHVWPNTTQFVRVFSQYLKPHANYLVEVPEVPIYYLQDRPDAQPRQFTSTFYINYKNSKKVLLTGPVGFTAAIDAGYFHEVAYSGNVTQAADAAIAKALSDNNDYYMAAEIQITDVLGPGDYFIWVKGHRPEPTGIFVHTVRKYQDLGAKVEELAP